MATTGGINTVIDAAVQGSDIGRGINENFDLSRSAINFAAGAGLQGGVEGVAKLLTPRMKSSSQLEAEVEAGPQPTGEVSPSQGPMPTEQMEMDFSFEPRQMEMDLQPPARDDTFRPPEMRDEQLEMPFVQEPRQMELDLNNRDLLDPLADDARTFLNRPHPREMTAEELLRLR